MASVQIDVRELRRMRCAEYLVGHAIGVVIMEACLGATGRSHQVAGPGECGQFLTSVPRYQALEIQLRGWMDRTASASPMESSSFSG